MAYQHCATNVISLLNKNYPLKTGKKIRNTKLY